MHVVVAGGGYAGLACLMDLAKRAPRARLTLLDPQLAHLKVTHLQECLSTRRDRYTRQFSELGQKYGFEHVAASAGDAKSDAAAMADWDRTGTVPLYRDDKLLDEMAFDYLVVATGAREIPLPGGSTTFSLTDLKYGEPQAMLAAAVGAAKVEALQAVVVGGGANGIQFVFALNDALRTLSKKAKLVLVDANESLLADSPQRMARYVSERLRKAGIEVLSDTVYEGSGTEGVTVRQGGDKRVLTSDFTLLLPGLAPWPYAMRVDRYGRLKLPQGFAQRIFAAGDCAHFDSRGLNSLTAQAAVRKGRQVAQNIARVSIGNSPLAYYFQELGFVLSLGAADAAGWLLVRDNVVTGLPAFAVKQVVEAQYDLFVAGLDTYVV